jgi:hypothetical protein
VVTCVKPLLRLFFFDYESTVIPMDQVANDWVAFHQDRDIRILLDIQATGIQATGRINTGSVLKAPHLPVRTL